MSRAPLGHELDEILGQTPAELVQRHISRFNDRIKSTGESYVLFGAGNLGKVALHSLARAGLRPVAFADNNPNLWNTSIDDITIYSPEEAVSRFSKTAVFVTSVYTNQPVWKQLLAQGVEPVSFAALAWKYAEAFLPYYTLELPDNIFHQAEQVQRAFSLWADDASRSEYLAQLRWRVTLDPSDLPPHLPQQEIYFLDDLIVPDPHEVFIDCGAFDGDTIREFIKRRSASYDRIIAIEPDPINFKTLQQYIASLPGPARRGLLAMQCAVGSESRTVQFEATGTVGSSSGRGSLEIEGRPLDELVKQYAPTFVKMDIEGAEPDALRGMRQIVQSNHPILAVCLYHRQDHLWQIPLLIKSLSDEYHLFLRRYSDECWELVCYAVPKTRLRG
ncbi:MAG TPA: FkbM family methyltransferase [Anaerolineales bacterium]|nr:FkbM family methyltransferase [Anaerolineales bacterium]